MPAIALPELRDGDLRLRLPASRDLDAITAACQDPGIVRFTRVPWPYGRADAEAFLAASEAGLAAGTLVSLVAVDPHDDRLLGAIGLSVDVRDLSGELGYWVVPAERGRGVAVRGGRLLLRLGFSQLDLGYVHLWSAAHNAASNAVAARLGFTHEGTARSSFLDGPTGDRSAPRGDANLWGLRPDELT